MRWSSSLACNGVGLSAVSTAISELCWSHADDLEELFRPVGECNLELILLKAPLGSRDTALRVVRGVIRNDERMIRTKLHCGRGIDARTIPCTYELSLVRG